uniref:Uncharacterized protein n=1 Tax=Sphaeramia orbicularis TaxID=375764 RepID=A0A672YAG5_9TELE
MATIIHVPSEDQFLCSICLDVFTDPVTTSCGHNFCKKCITAHWDNSDQYLCPMCKMVFNPRPELHVNTFISEMVEQFRQNSRQEVNSSSSEMCREHNKALELFCKSDRTCVCMICTVLDHKNHNIVPLKEEYERVRAELRRTGLSKKTADRETDTVVEAVTQLEDELRKVMMSVKGEIRRVQRFEVDVTLDPDTAHPRLVLSDDGKQVHDGGCWRKLPDNPQRFSHSPSVLGKQSFSSGRFYFEVQVKGVTHWTLGVVKESINRKQRVTLRPESSNWTMGLRNGDHYYGYGSPPVCLQLKSSPQKVGVFVDYEEGLVSFYDVDTAELTYSMTGCCFEEKLRPYFSLSGMTVLL